jgi:hypothetical protein
MNPGVTEEVGGAARTFISSMASQPVMLGMVILMLAMIGLFWYTFRFAGEARKTEFEMIFSQQKEVMDILAKCIVPERKE